MQSSGMLSYDLYNILALGCVFKTLHSEYLVSVLMLTKVKLYKPIFLESWL